MFKRIFLLAALLGALVWLQAGGQPALAVAWESKVDSSLLATLRQQGPTAEVEFLIGLKATADTTPPANLTTKEAKGQYVFEQLTAVAEQSQAPLLAILEQNGVEHRAYWVANAIWVRGTADLLSQFARRADVAYLYANPSIPLLEPAPPAQQIDEALQMLAIEWGVAKINAPSVWAQGFTGQGVVVAGQDTGYQWDHPALKNHYRGWNGSTADHNYNWHDAIHGDGAGGNGTNPCGFNIVAPCDDNGHGTHTMGTMVGDDGGSNQVGVAPGAKWMACRNMEEGDGTPTTYIECFQWFLAPTDLANANPNPALAPHVINNSWSCPTVEGCNLGNFGLMQTAVENLRNAGVMVVVSAGNAGAGGCSTVNTPAAIFDASYTVGNTTSADAIAGSSSRGPVTIDGSNRMKPDISAPGTGIRSAYPPNSYASLSGTSMAGPHVVGAVALLISAEPALAGDVDMIEQLLNGTALPRTTAQGCGGDSPTAVPNNVFGHGRVDVFAAYQLLQHTFSISKSGPAAVYVGQPITYTLTITHNNNLTATTNVVLTDTLPTGSTLVTATVPYTLNGNVVTWQWANMAPNASTSVNLVVQVDTAQNISNSVYGVQSDDAPFATAAAVNTTVIMPEHALELSKTAPASVAIGSPIAYTLAMTHTHPLGEATQNVWLTDTLPANTTFITATLPYSLDGNVVSWYWPSVAAGQSASVELVVQPTVTSTATIVNEVYGVQSDDVAAVSGPAVETLVTAHSLELSKTATAEVMAGAAVTYTLTFTHSHPLGEATTNVWLTDTLPAGTTFITATLPYSMDGDVVSWYWPTVADGQTVSVELVVQAPVVTETTTISNAFYAVQSDDVAAVTGTAVETLVQPQPFTSWFLYLPLITRP